MICHLNNLVSNTKVIVVNVNIVPYCVFGELED